MDLLCYESPPLGAGIHFWITITLSVCKHIHWLLHLPYQTAQLRTVLKKTLGGKLMTPKKYLLAFTFSALSLAIFLGPLGCGPDPGMYHGETLTFETPVANKSDEQLTEEERISKLDLGASESSDFYWGGHAGYGYGYGYDYGPYWGGGYPLYDYYLEPLPVAVPVSPAYALVDYVHPFYAFAAFNPFWDDDDGLYFRRDDD